MSNGTDGAIKFLRESIDFQQHTIKVLKEQLAESHARRAALEEENEHLKAANSNARFIQLCMKEAAEKAAAEHGALKEDHEQLKAEHEQLKKVSEKVYAKFGEERLEREIAADKLLNFDDENYDYYWSATNGDVVFWKVPNDLADLPHPEDPDILRVHSAFMDELFGDEWGVLSSFGVRTMTKQDVIDADGFVD